MSYAAAVVGCVTYGLLFSEMDFLALIYLFRLLRHHRHHRHSLFAEASTPIISETHSSVHCRLVCDKYGLLHCFSEME